MRRLMCLDEFEKYVVWLVSPVIDDRTCLLYMLVGILSLNELRAKNILLLIQ